jgi:hypothetical protein
MNSLYMVAVTLYGQNPAVPADQVGADAGHLADHPDPFGQLDQGDDQRELLARQREMVVDDETEHLAGTVCYDVSPVARGAAGRAHGAGRVTQAPQLAQRWMRSSPAAVPAQKNAVSGVICGRITGSGVCPSPGRAEGGGGMNHGPFGQKRIESTARGPQRLHRIIRTRFTVNWG